MGGIAGMPGAPAGGGIGTGGAGAGAAGGALCGCLRAAKSYNAFQSQIRT